MAAMFSSPPKPPKPPPPTPPPPPPPPPLPPPAPDETSVQEAETQVRRQEARKGRKSTILTSPAGIPSAAKPRLGG